MTWQTEIRKNEIKKKIDANLEVKMNKAISDINSMMQPFLEAGFLDYDEHQMAFVDITDKIMNRMMAHATDLD
jgi:hypothetical protein|tara:strand:- start:2296 stop:2514 length:219 start_codon:yes stop_codon:yes gene_type:complete